MSPVARTEVDPTGPDEGAARLVPRVRAFNRLVTERIGALNDAYLSRGRPLGASRVLWEVGSAAEGVELRDVRSRLGLDSGYLSRLLRTLEADGLVEVGQRPDDRRVRSARLTARGRAEVALLDRRSDELALSLLAPLSGGQRERLVTAMGEVERLMTASAVELQTVDPEEPEVRYCLERYFAELAARDANRFEPGEALPTADEMRPPSGVFVIAYLRGQAVGCCGLKFNAAGMPDVAEVRRMWVDPETRGLGLGRRLLEHVEGLALEQGVARLRLDTNEHLVEAIAMYRSAGYVDIPRYTDEAFATHWFEKSLAESP